MRLASVSFTCVASTFVTAETASGEPLRVTAKALVGVVEVRSRPLPASVKVKVRCVPTASATVLASTGAVLSIVTVRVTSRTLPTLSVERTRMVYCPSAGWPFQVVEYGLAPVTAAPIAVEAAYVHDAPAQ